MFPAMLFPIANLVYGELTYGDGFFSGLLVLPTCKSVAFFHLTIIGKKIVKIVWL